VATSQLPQSGVATRLIINENGVSSSHGLLTSSPPLFSLGTSNLSKLDDDDVVMFFKKFVTPPPPPKRFA
jgi:hypothetical protein